MKKAKPKSTVARKKTTSPKRQTSKDRKLVPAQIVVSKMYKDRGIVTQEEGGITENINIAPLVPDTPVCSVEYASQMTVNLGNFESVQCRVGVTLPAYLEEAEEAFQVAQSFVDNRLTRVVNEIKDYREKARGAE